MTRAQYTVLGLLLAAAGLHIWLDPAAQSNFKQFLSIRPDNWRQMGSVTISGYMFWLISLAAVLLLAEYAPHVAIWIAVLILTGAVLINNAPIANWLSNATAAIRPQASNKPN